MHCTSTTCNLCTGVSCTKVQFSAISVHPLIRSLHVLLVWLHCHFLQCIIVQKLAPIRTFCSSALPCCESFMKTQLEVIENSIGSNWKSWDQSLVWVSLGQLQNSFIIICHQMCRVGKFSRRRKKRDVCLFQRKWINSKLYLDRVN